VWQGNECQLLANTHIRFARERGFLVVQQGIGFLYCLFNAGIFNTVGGKGAFS